MSRRILGPQFNRTPRVPDRFAHIGGIPGEERHPRQSLVTIGIKNQQLGKGHDRSIALPGSCETSSLKQMEVPLRGPFRRNPCQHLQGIRKRAPSIEPAGAFQKLG